MKKCKTCGAEFTDDISVCSLCGGEVEDIIPENENADNADGNAADSEAAESAAGENEQTVKPKKSKAGIAVAIILIVIVLGIGGFFLYKHLSKSPFEILSEKLSMIESVDSYTMDIDGNVTVEETDVSVSAVARLENNDEVSKAQMDISVEVPILGAIDFTGAFSGDLKAETAKVALSAMGQTQAYALDLSGDTGSFDGLKNAKTLDEAIDEIIDIIYENMDDEDLDKVDKEKLKTGISESLTYLNSREALKEIWHYEKKDGVYSVEADVKTVCKVFVDNLKPAFKDAADYESAVAEFNEWKDEDKAAFRLSFTVEKGDLTSLNASIAYSDSVDLSVSFIIKDNLPAEMSLSAKAKEEDTVADISLTLVYTEYNKTTVEFSEDMLEAFENAEELKLDDIFSSDVLPTDNDGDDTSDTDSDGTAAIDYEHIAKKACEQHLADYGKFAQEAYVVVLGDDDEWIIYEIENDMPVLVIDAQQKDEISEKLFGESFDTNDLWTKSEGYDNDTTYWCVIENDKTCTTAFNDIVDTYDVISANGVALDNGVVFIWKSGSKKRIFRLDESGSIVVVASSLEDETIDGLEELDTSDMDGASGKVKVYVVK